METIVVFIGLMFVALIIIGTIMIVQWRFEIKPLGEVKIVPVEQTISYKKSFVLRENTDKGWYYLYKSYGDCYGYSWKHTLKLEKAEKFESQKQAQQEVNKIQMLRGEWKLEE